MDKIRYCFRFSRELQSAQTSKNVINLISPAITYQSLQLSFSSRTLGGGSTDDKALLHAILRMLLGDHDAV